MIDDLGYLAFAILLPENTRTGGKEVVYCLVVSVSTSVVVSTTVSVLPFEALDDGGAIC